MVVDAATGLRAMAGTVKAANSDGDGTECDEFIFTFIVIWSVALLTFDSTAAVAPVDLGTTVSIAIEDSIADDAVPDVIAVAAAGTTANGDCNPATDTDAGADANMIDFAADAGNPPLTPPATAPEVGLLVHCNTGSDGCGIAVCDAASPVAVVVIVVAMAVALLLLLLFFDTVVVNAGRENTGIVAEPQRDRKIDGDGVTAAMLRTAAAEAEVEDTGGTKAGVGAVGPGHVTLVFLLAATAAFVVVELPQGLCTHRVTGVVAGGDAIVVVVGLAIECGGIGFEGNGRVVIIAVIVGVGSVVIEALVVMISLATGLDIDDDNNVADLGFDVVVAATAAAVFVVVPFTAIVASAAKAAVDAVSLADGSTDGTIITGGGSAGAGTCGGNGASDGRIRADAVVVVVCAITPTLR